MKVTGEVNKNAKLNSTPTPPKLIHLWLQFTLYGL